MNWHSAQLRRRVYDGNRGFVSSPFPRIFYALSRRETSAKSLRFEAELTQKLAQFLRPGLSISDLICLVRAFFISNPKSKSILTIFNYNQSTNLKYIQCFGLSYFNFPPISRNQMPKPSYMKINYITEKSTFCPQKGRKERLWRGIIMFQKNYIVIDGIIGTGKSTLTKTLSAAMGYEPYYEPVQNNPYLEDFYKDMKRYGFAMQVYYLNARYRQMKTLGARIGSGEIKGAIADRGIWCDTIFAKMLFEQGNIDKRDYACYQDLFDNFVLRDMPFPQMIVYLKCSPETALKRIKARGRGAENDMPIDYLCDLKQHYEDFLSDIQTVGVKVLTLDWEEFQPVENVVKAIHDAGIESSESFSRWVRPSHL